MPVADEKHVVALRTKCNNLLGVLRFISNDQNSALDYEARLIIEGAINDSVCPKCGGEADNGYDNCDPQGAYMCSICCAKEDREAHSCHMKGGLALAVNKAVEGEVLPPETPLHQQARELLEEIQAEEAMSRGALKLQQ